MQNSKITLLGFVMLVLPFVGSAEEEEMVAVEMTAVNYSDFPSMVNADDLGFKILAPFIGDEDLYIRHADGGYRRIQPVREGLSRTHYYSGASPLVLHREGKDEEGETIYLPAGSVDYKSSTQDIVICLQKRGDKYLGFTIDLSLKGQELGSVRFVNFTPANLVVLLNDKREALKPGGDIITTFESKKKTYFNFKIGAMYEEEAKMVYSKRHPFRGDMRILFIGYASQNAQGGESPFRVVSHYDKGPEVRPIFAE